MSSSDWLQLLLSLIGFLGGAVISWIFFRAQQTTDFNSLRDLLNKISHDIGSKDRFVIGKLTGLDKTISKYDETMENFTMTIGGVKELTDVSKRLDTLEELNKIKSTIEDIDSKLNSAVISIISEVREQQKALSNTLQGKFKEQWRTALPIIETSLKRELLTIVPAPKEQDKLLEKMLSLVEQAVNRAGEYQRLYFAQSLSSALSKIETSVNGVVGDVTNEVQGLENKLDGLLLALPRPTSSKKTIESKDSDGEQKENMRQGTELK